MAVAAQALEALNRPVEVYQDDLDTHVGVSPGRAAQSFWKLMLGTAVLAGLTHVAFGSLFWWAGVKTLALVNVGSVLLYVLCFWLLRSGQGLVGMSLIALEVLGHAALAVYWIGWDSGFHYYAILVVPVLIVADIPRLAAKAAVVGGTVVVYLAMDIWLRRAVPPFALDPVVLDSLHYFNLVTCLGILVFLVGVYFRLVTQAESQLRIMATTDPLTRLLNRRSVMSAARAELQRSARTGMSVCLVLADIDHFKSINDRYGHDTGDLVLRSVSQALAAGVRELDHVARWGGEEFLVVLPSADLTDAEVVAGRLREGVAQLRLQHGALSVPVTMTFGVCRLQDGESLESAIARADAALYRGKHAGRDRVEVAPSIAT